MTCLVVESGSRCDGPHRARGMCSKHLERWRKHGDPLHVDPLAGRPPKYGVPGYHAAHKRVTRTFGSAAEHQCGCGAQAAHWALAVAPTLFDVDCGLGYSLYPADYKPLCVRCHYHFDGKKVLRDELGRIRGSTVTGAVIRLRGRDEM